MDFIEEIFDDNYKKKIKKIVGKGILTLDIDENDDKNYQITIKYKQNINSFYIYIATFYLDELPGCCGVCVFNNLRIDSYYRKLGLGKLALDFATLSSIISGLTPSILIFCLIILY